MPEGKVLEIIADKKKWVSVSSMGGCYVESVDVNRRGLKIDSGNGCFMKLPNQSWDMWYQINYTEEDRRDPDRNYISPDEGLVCDIFGDVCDIFGNVLGMELGSKSGHVNFHEVEIDYENYVDDEKNRDWEQYFSKEYNSKVCECYYCSLAREWVEKIEQLILKEGIGKQYKEVYLHESIFMETQKSFKEDGNGRFWELEDEKLPLMLSKSHEIVSSQKVTRKKKRKYLRMKKQKNGKTLDDRYKNHHRRITRSQARKLSKMIDPIFIHNHPMGEPPKIAVNS